MRHLPAAGGGRLPSDDPLQSQPRRCPALPSALNGRNATRLTLSGSDADTGPAAEPNLADADCPEIGRVLRQHLTVESRCLLRCPAVPVLHGEMHLVSSRVRGLYAGKR
jgi:hypothetical protein